MNDQAKVTFDGLLTVRNAKRHILHKFNVPADATRLEVRFACEPAKVHGLGNMLTLSLFDPHRFRGARHRGGNRHELFIDVNAATPGYVTGLLPAGEWTVQVDTHRIMPGAPLRYSLEIEIGFEPAASAMPIAPKGKPGAVVRTEPGWYCGDLHSHTDHSDAGDRSVTQLIEAARAVSLDFLFVTDHNTTSPLAEVDAAAGPALLTAGGMELTTFWGHALVLGTRQWVDWRFRPGEGAINRLTEDVYANNQLFIIAHPCSGGDPHCTGCAWRFGEMMPGAARIVEVWNGRWEGDSNNEQALALYYDWLNQGHRLVATAGSDTHNTADYTATTGFNVIYAEELSEAALLRAIRAGHLYLSSGPRLILKAREQNGAPRMMGDTVRQAADVTVHWQDAPHGAVVRVLANGQLLHQQAAGGPGSYTWSATPSDASWLLAEMRGVDGVLLSLTNPLYLTAA